MSAVEVNPSTIMILNSRHQGVVTKNKKQLDRQGIVREEEEEKLSGRDSYIVLLNGKGFLFIMVT